MSSCGWMVCNRNVVSAKRVASDICGKLPNSGRCLRYTLWKCDVKASYKCEQCH